MFNIIKLSLNFLVGYEKQDNYFQLVLLNLLEWIKGIKITNLLEKLSLIGGGNESFFSAYYSST